MEGAPSRKAKSGLTQDVFDRLLAWLDQDRDQAGARYEKIRSRLITIFFGRGCAVPEELADETIDRVARKVQEISATYVGDPALYFYGVANIVYLEYVKRTPVRVQPPPPRSFDETEIELKHQCLEQCLEQLSPENRELIVAYYGQEKKLKIESRKEMAERLGTGLNALWIRAHRIRQKLTDCVNECLDRERGRVTI